MLLCEIFQARIVAISSSGDLPNPGIKPTSPVSPTLQVDSTIEPMGKPLKYLLHLTLIRLACEVHIHHYYYYFHFTAEEIGARSFSSVQLLSCVQLFATPWFAAHQASLSITNFQSLLKLMSIESVMPSNHFTLWCPLPSVFPSTRVFINESVLRIKWPKYWHFSCIARSLDNLFKVTRRTSDRVRTGTRPL